MKANLALIEQAAADPAKFVFVSTWPGLFVTTGTGKPGLGQLDKMMNPVVKMMNFVFKMMIFVFKALALAGRPTRTAI